MVLLCGCPVIGPDEDAGPACPKDGAVDAQDAGAVDGPPAVVQTPLDSHTIPKFVEPLPRLSVAGGTINTVFGTQPLTLSMCEFKSHALPRGTFSPGVKPETWVWGYIAGDKCPTTTQDTFTGPVIVAQRFVPTRVKYINQLGDTSTSHLLAYVNSTDQTLHWADPLNRGANQCHMASMMMSDPRMAPSPECAAHYAGSIPAVAHLHGGEVPSWIDGGPGQWFTSDGKWHGNNYYSAPGAAGNEAIFTYPNTQQAGPLWFHDHTLGATRLNVYAGLAGAYLLTDPSQRLPYGLPGPAEIIPVVIQDRMFDTNGQLLYPAGPGFALNPEHPWWMPEFIGDTILVNGKVWPYIDVEPKRYRFLILEGSNARSYELFLTDQTTGAMGPPLWVIGTDGGYLDKPVKVDPAAGNKLLIMPGERYEVLIDFAGLPAGTTLVLRNTAAAPYPSGDPVDPDTTGQIMQFRITGAPVSDDSFDPAGKHAILRGHGSDKIVRLADSERGVLNVKPAKIRQLTLNEVMGDPVTLGGVTYPGGPMEILVNNTRYSGESSRNYGDFVPINQGGIVTAFSELPKEGETEQWEIVNLTADAHPIHLHLVQFQIVNRQDFAADSYAAFYAAAFPGGAYIPSFGPPLDYRAALNTLSGGKDGGNPNVDSYLTGVVQLPRSEEAGWKDTIRAMPGQVTRIVVRWAPTDLPAKLKPEHCFYPFDPGNGPGYVWHCHIIDHEDNEMMRPTQVLRNEWRHVWRTFVKGTDY
jgi:FtsP/CotA-like multicopper oxidase with cupredoxin domain